MPYVEYDEIEAICSECGRVFRSEEALVTHKEESHSGLEALAPRPAAKRPPPSSSD
ncbi:MAG: C2H2-type zinc finger protein [Thermoplasmata archaeon]